MINNSKLNNFYLFLLFKKNESLLGFCFLCIYALSYQFGLSLASYFQQISPLWPTTGVALGIMILYGPKCLPYLGIGSFLISYFVKNNLLSSLLIMSGSLLEAYIGYLIVIKFKNIKTSYFNDTSLSLIGIFMASLLSTPINACLGTIAIIGADQLFSSSGFYLFYTRWLGGLIGGVMFTSFFIMIIKTSLNRYITKKLWTLSILLFVSSIFIKKLYTTDNIAPFLFLIYFLIFFSVKYFNQLYSRIYIYIISTFFIYYSIYYPSIFSDKSIILSSLKTQFLLVSLYITFLFLTTLKRSRIAKYATSALFLMWILCGGLYFHLNLSNEKIKNSQFNNKVQNLEERILTKIQVYDEALQARVYEPFVIEKFFKEVLTIDDQDISFDIFHGPKISKSQLIYQSLENNKIDLTNNNVSDLSHPFNKPYDKITSLKIGKNDFQFGWRKGNTFFSAQSNILFLIFIFGSLFSLLIYLIVFSFENTSFNTQFISNIKNEDSFKFRSGNNIGIGTKKHLQASPNKEYQNSNLNTSNLSILVVDDNEINLKIVKMTINRLGYKCDLANSGAEVLRMMDSKQYDLIFIDCFMPDMDGFTTTEKIRIKYNTYDHPRIVAVTASLLKEDHDRCFYSGMNSIVIKPIKAELLNEEIKEANSNLSKLYTNPSQRKKSA